MIEVGPCQDVQAELFASLSNKDLVFDWKEE